MACGTGCDSSKTTRPVVIRSVERAALILIGPRSHGIDPIKPPRHRVHYGTRFIGVELPSAQSAHVDLERNKLLTRKLHLAIHLDAEDVGIAQGIGQGVAENWVVFIQLGDVPRSAFP